MHIPKKFYTKSTYVTLLREKLGGSGAPRAPIIMRPWFRVRSGIGKSSIERNRVGFGYGY
ncbi:hypothetical protein HanIR_Chr00c17g0909361 [Helianthus annuus]|nr:hypothetical protein HanIR_Chr00c17g0909361 [Helianthus annuus]